MKSVESKTSASQAKTNSPFFQKRSEQSFFRPGKSDPPFFPKSPSKISPIQTKLTVGQPNDIYEKEADAMADKVVQRMSEPGAAPLSPVTPLTNASFVQEKCAHCEREEQLQKKPIFESEAEHVQRNPESSEPATASPSIEKSLQSSKGSGSPLPNATRQQMESGFGADFSAVRIHDDTSARQMSKGLNAQAFTHGSDIYFNSGKYDTNSKGGQHLLAHELTHVVQQGKNVVRRFGQDNYCKDDKHLKPFIWPGQHKAVQMLNNTITALTNNDPTLAQRVPQFFGKQGMAHLSEILTAYKAILTAVNGNYNYHCNDSSNNNPDAKKCNGERAETDLNNPHRDITLCFDVINSNWSDVDVGALIIHENWHRAFGSSSHPWAVPENPPNCANNTNAINSNLLIDNPDSYACMAIFYA